MSRLFPRADWADAQAIASIAYCNPFTEQRIELEAAVAGASGRRAIATWNLRPDATAQNPVLERVISRTAELVEPARAAIAKVTPSPEECECYEAIVFFHLYHKYVHDLDLLIDNGDQQVSFYDNFSADATRFLQAPSLRETRPDAAHLLACLYQIRRAFHYTHYFLIGSSQPMATLRAAIWESVFSHDMRRYRAGLYRHMRDFATLITGPSGTGKELVARAIGKSQYVAYEPRKRAFVGSPAVHAVNLSALSPNLIESELFGARRGAFTGAESDHTGWFETCGTTGSVFLDEIGELDPAVQVKLLRLLQTRTFERIGETQQREFSGKLITATNRSLDTEFEAGRMRPDFYYRLCADCIRTPTLNAQLKDEPAQLGLLVKHLTRDNAGEDIAIEATPWLVEWIVTHLGTAYRWSGNVRELEQCIRSLLIHGTYVPIGDNNERVIEDAQLTLDQFVARHCTRAYFESGSYVAAAERLATDRRTVKAKLDTTYLAELQKKRQGGYERR